MTEDEKEMVKKYAEFLADLDKFQLAYICTVLLSTVAEYESLSTEDMIDFVKSHLKETKGAEQC